jgi:dTDP-4-dehydrorhamnose 3,5-epimerase
MKDPKKFHLNIYEDERGAFSEIFRATSHDVNFVQDNLSVSKSGVLRGLHHQTIKPQGKLVVVLDGNIQDVIVSLKTKSVFSYDLKRGDCLWVPPNYLHGFLCLTDSMVMYKCTNYYDSGSEISVDAFDSHLDIEWKIDRKNIIRSEKDSSALLYDEVIS